jgi:hypothetical protein
LTLAVSKFIYLLKKRKEKYFFKVANFIFGSLLIEFVPVKLFPVGIRLDVNRTRGRKKRERKEKQREKEEHCKREKVRNEKGTRKKRERKREREKVEK